MRIASVSPIRSPRNSKIPARRLFALAALLLSNLLCGCAALTNPVKSGIPVSSVPAELLGETHDEQFIPLNLLRRMPPDVYRVAPGDVLGVWFEGVPLLSQPNQLPPITQVQRNLPPERTDLPPALGLPFPVQEDGTLGLPLVKPVSVAGMTLKEVQATIRDAYVKSQLIQPGTERLIVTLMRLHPTHVLVFRHDISSQSTFNANQNNNFVVTNVGTSNGDAVPVGRSPAGLGYLVDLPGSENDVLTALALTGGLPSSTAVNEIVIYRSLFKGERDRHVLLQQLESHRPGCKGEHLVGVDGTVVRIPLRLGPGDTPQIKPEDVVLHEGDVVFVEAEELQFYYTGGLLPPAQHLLPRDYDLRVVQAILQARGPLVNGAFSQSNLSGQIIPRGIGDPSPSLLSVLRPTPGGGQMIIRVNLNRALRDPRENLLVQPGDVLVLQETPTEAFARYFTQVFDFTLIWQAIQTNRTHGTVNVMVP
jgi:protein involved in polysaccharide export with SLBB domain